MSFDIKSFDWFQHNVFTERDLQEGFHFSLNADVNVTVVSYINNNSREIKFTQFFTAIL